MVDDPRDKEDRLRGDGAPPPRDRDARLAAAAERALAEAAARRAAVRAPDRPREIGGRDGPEPVRFGDWERRGVAVDF
jgi:hypothetical protein